MRYRDRKRRRLDREGREEPRRRRLGRRDVHRRPSRTRVGRTVEMGRDKKNPKPLDVSAFHTLIKTASQVITRHEQALHASLNKTVTVDTDGARWTVALKIVPDEDDPHGLLSAENAFGERVEAVRVRADFKLNVASANAWVADEFRKPR